MNVVTTTINRLVATAIFKQVEGALQLSELLSGTQLPQNLPAAFVLEESETAGSNVAATTLHRQQVVTRLAVVVFVRQPGARRGGELVDEIGTLTAQIKTNLLGWSPSAEHSPLIYRGSRLLWLGQGKGAVQVTFEVEHQLRYTAQG